MEAPKINTRQIGFKRDDVKKLMNQVTLNGKKRVKDCLNLKKQKEKINTKALIFVSGNNFMQEAVNRANGGYEISYK